MQSINILDMRTLLLGNIVSVLICVIFMAILWRHSHHRFPATVFWLRSFAMQLLALLLIILRGTIPDFISIMMSGVLITTGDYPALHRSWTAPWKGTIATLQLCVSGHISADSCLFHLHRTESRTSQHQLFRISYFSC
jgi:hypothetical protein